MKIVLTLLVRDEEDILEANLRHHLAEGVDEIIVTDNRSVDGTPAILDRFAAEHPVTVLREPADDYSQRVWVTRMARLAATEHSADWVIHADADEFYMAEQGSLRDAFSAVPPECSIIRVPRLNFEALQGGPSQFYERMVVRQTLPTNVLGQPLPDKVCHRADPRVVVEQGNHAITGVEWTAWDERPLVIFHYPARTYAQYENKIKTGGRAYANNPELPPGLGETWRAHYELYREGKLRDWYRAHELSTSQIAVQLAAGEVVIDRRMEQRLRGHLAEHAEPRLRDSA